MPAWRIGASVRHRRLGVGRVLAEKQDGGEVLVDFAGGVQWVRTRDVLAEGVVEERPPPPTRTEARAIVESMRLGIAPPVGIERCTVGRSFEVATVREWLRNEAEGALVLEGAYGSGKSHLLRYLRSDALALGFAVTLASVDPSEGVLTVPRRAYAHLVRDLAVPLEGTVVGFEGALERAAQLPAVREAMRDHIYFGPALDALATGTLPESAWGVLRGERTHGARLPPLYDHQTAANLACYLLSGLGFLLGTAFDTRGVLLLFDEVETAPDTRYGYERLHAKNLLRALTLIACDDDVVLTETVRRDGTTVGEETRLLYSGHLPVRYLYAIPSRLKCLFAVTPETLLPVFRGWRQTVPRLEVAPLSDEELRALFELTCALYADAYGMEAPAARRPLYTFVRERTPGDQPRLFLKGTVELLDFLRFHPGAVPQDALR